MARLRYNLLETTLAADITDADVTITFTAALLEGGVDIPTVASDILAVRIGSEILHVTAYTSGATSATVLRGQEDTEAAEHFAGDAVKNVVTKEDFQADSGGGGSFSVLIAAVDSSVEDQAKADFVCDGTNDEVVFQNVIDTYGTVNGSTLRIDIASGLYHIGAAIDIDCQAAVWIVGNPDSKALYSTGYQGFSKAVGNFTVFACSGFEVRGFQGIYIDESAAESISALRIFSAVRFG